MLLSYAHMLPIACSLCVVIVHGLPSWPVDYDHVLYLTVSAIVPYKIEPPHVFLQLVHDVQNK